MTDPVLDEVELVVDALKGVSPEEQEAAILELEERNPGVGERVRALLVIERQAIEAIRKAEADGRRIVAKAKARAEAVRKPAEPKAKPELRIVAAEQKPVEKPVEGWRFVQRADGSKWMVRGNDLRRWFGPVPQLKVVEQAKPEPEKRPDPEPKPKEEPKADRGLVPVAPSAVVGDWDDAIAAMNRQHAIIENVGGKAVIASWEPSTIDPSRMVVVFQNKESFLLRYSNRFVSIEVHAPRGIGTVRVPVGQWWLTHRDRQQYRGVTFRPAGPKVVDRCLNLWQGWGVEARAGDWGLIRNHIREVIAGGNKEFGDYIENWIAWSIQNPALQAEVALVLIGLKGVGKGTLVRCLQRIFGAHAFQVTSREEVIGKFNGHLQDCVLFVVDEAYWGGDKRCVGRLQGMITEPTLPIERKGIDLIQVPNYLHVVMLAEPGWVIPAGRYERRYAAFDVSAVKKRNRAYFRALHREIAEGGAEAMFYDLGRMDLGDWHPRDIPDVLLTNAALQRQQGFTLPPLEQWYLMLLHDGALPGGLGNRPNTALTRNLLDDAKERVPRLKWDLTEVALRNFLVDEVDIPCTKYRAGNANGWKFAPLDELREAWARRWGPVEWDNPEKECGKKPKPDLLDRKMSDIR